MVRFAISPEIQAAVDIDRTSEFPNPSTYHERYDRSSKYFRTVFPFETERMLRTYTLNPGKVVQGGADAVRPFYTTVKECEVPVIIVNCARRFGDPKEDIQGHRTSNEVGSSTTRTNRILWLPMTEGKKEVMCRDYLQRHADGLLEDLRTGFTVVVNCQEGLHRSVEFTNQLLKICECASPWSGQALAGTGR